LPPPLYLVVTAEPSIYTQIRVATFSDSLLHLSKVIAAAETVAICTAAVAIASSVSLPTTALGARTLDPTPFPSSTDASTFPPSKQLFLVYTVSGGAFGSRAMISLVDEAEYGFAVRLMALAEAPLVLEKACPHPGRIGESGLEGILGGVELVGSKLVCTRFGLEVLTQLLQSHS
jgi:hypothetical protein